MRSSKCYNCGRFGHFASMCSNRQVFQQSWSIPDRTLRPPPEPPLPPNPPAPPPPPPVVHLHYVHSQDDGPVEPAPDFNALIDETISREDAWNRPPHPDMSIINEAGEAVYQLPSARRSNRNIVYV
jgi:hypothetical protein